MNQNDNDKTLYNATDIQQYLSGRMSAKEMHKLEKAALEDPFLADAIDGFQDNQAVPLNTSNDVKELHERLEKRIFAPNKKTLITSYYKYLKAAAVVLLIGGSAVTLYFLTNNLDNPKTTVATTSVSKNKKNNNDSFSAPVPASEQSTVTAIPKKDVPVPELLKDKSSEPIQKSARGVSSEDAVQNPIKAPAPGYVLKKYQSVMEKDEEEMAARKEIAMKRQSNTMRNGPEMNALQKASPANIFSGTVVNQNNQPVPNASVSVLPEPQQSYLATDSNGKFQIVTADSVVTVMVTGTGYDTVQTTLDGKVAGVEIKLKPLNDALGDVVVSGSGSNAKNNSGKRSPKEKLLVMPESGIAAFNNYVAHNKKVDATIHGEVVLSFTVNKNGKPGGFKVEKSASPLLDAEAIRLVKEGPKWRSLKSSKVRDTITINF